MNEFNHLLNPFNVIYFPASRSPPFITLFFFRTTICSFSTMEVRYFYIFACELGSFILQHACSFLFWFILRKAGKTKNLLYDFHHFRNFWQFAIHVCYIRPVYSRCGSIWRDLWNNRSIGSSKAFCNSLRLFHSNALNCTSLSLGNHFILRNFRSEQHSSRCALFRIVDRLCFGVYYQKEGKEKVFN